MAPGAEAVVRGHRRAAPLVVPSPHIDATAGSGCRSGRWRRGRFFKRQICVCEADSRVRTTSSLKIIIGVITDNCTLDSN